MEKTTQEVMLQLANELHGFSSIDVDVTLRQQTLVDIGDNKAGASESLEHFIATSRDELFYERKMITPGPERSVWAGYCDGKKCASVSFNKPPRQAVQKAITISKTFLNEQVSGYAMRPEPLRFHYVGLIPLDEALPQAARSGSSNNMGRKCNVFVFESVPGRKSTRGLVYHLDERTSIPIKVESFASEERRNTGRPSWIWEALTIEEVQGFHVPIKSKYTSYIVDDSGSSREKIVEDYTISRIEFNATHPASVFWPAPDAGVAINNLIKKEYYYNTPDKKAPPLSVQSVEAPIVAEEPADWTAYYSGFGAVVVAVLLIAAVRWKTSRD